MKARHAQQLIMVSGLPGSGKTTFARALSAKTGIPHLNTDMIRHDLGKTGLYDTANKRMIYDEMLKRTEKYLAGGQSVIIDATFHKQKNRMPFIALANSRHLTVFWIKIKASDDTIRQRLKHTRQFSEADFSVYLKIKAEYDPLEQNHLTLWSDKINIDVMINEALAYLTDD